MANPVMSLVANGFTHADGLVIVQNWYNASDALQHEKTWFWWADKQKREAVRQRKTSEREARAVLRKHEKHIQVAMNPCMYDRCLLTFIWCIASCVGCCWCRDRDQTFDQS